MKQHKLAQLQGKGITFVQENLRVVPLLGYGDELKMGKSDHSIVTPLL